VACDSLVESRIRRRRPEVVVQKLQTRVPAVHEHQQVPERHDDVIREPVGSRCLARVELVPLLLIEPVVARLVGLHIADRVEGPE
jgi:hypothetical protein